MDTEVIVNQDEEASRRVGHQFAFTASRQILFLAILLPAFVAGTNQALLVTIGKRYWLSDCLYPWMVFTTALLSWCVGRYLKPTWLASLVFLWCLALLDFLTNAACLNNTVPPEIGYVLVSSQITFAVVCAILGPWRWQWRLPTILVAVAAVIIQSSCFMDGWNARPWNALMMLTALIATLVCIALRAAGFKLTVAASSQSSTASKASFDPSQFSVKHLLFWATALVPLLLVARELDGRSLRVLSKGGWMQAALLIGCLAAIDLTALWAILGRRFVLGRLALFLAVPFVISKALTIYSADLAVQNKMWGVPPIVEFLMIDMRDLWASWTWLAITLTAALLLFLRASGYQLVRSSLHRTDNAVNVAA